MRFSLALALLASALAVSATPIAYGPPGPPGPPTPAPPPPSTTTITKEHNGNHSHNQHNGNHSHNQHNGNGNNRGNKNGNNGNHDKGSGDGNGNGSGSHDGNNDGHNNDNNGHNHDHDKHVFKGNQCQENQQESCCNAPNGDAVAGLQCTIGLLGGTCSGSVQCCDVTGSGTLNLINLCVPINA